MTTPEGGATLAGVCDCARLRAAEIELLALLRAARQYVPSLTELAFAIDAKWPIELSEPEVDEVYEGFMADSPGRYVLTTTGRRALHEENS